MTRWPTSSRIPNLLRCWTNHRGTRDKHESPARSANACSRCSPKTNAIGDPALDAAAFAGFGWPLVKRVRPASYERARTHAAMFPLTGAASALRQDGDPERFLAWFRRRCAVREHPPAS